MLKTQVTADRGLWRPTRWRACSRPVHPQPGRGRRLPPMSRLAALALATSAAALAGCGGPP